MKASLRFRDDQKPLVRAKIPVSIFGLPFLSGVSAGETKELRLDLGTAFESGPSLRLSYRPNDPWNPFSLAVKTGAGTFGSPAASAMTMSAEFNLVGRGGPSFTIQIKPRFGDFCVKKSTCSAPPAFVLGRTVVVDHAGGGEGSVDGVGFFGKKPNGVPTGNLATTAGGVRSLLSGAEITARSVLPLRDRADVKFHWGVRIPSDLRSPFTDDLGYCKDPIAGVSLRKLPFLVMSKVSIEHVPAQVAPRQKPMDLAEACASVQRQLATLQAENGMLRKAVEELRAGLGAGGAPLLTPGGGTIPADKGSRFDAGGRKPGAGDRNGAKTAPFTKKDGSRSVGRKDANEGGGAATKEDVSEELRKALTGAAGAGI